MPCLWKVVDTLPIVRTSDALRKDTLQVFEDGMKIECFQTDGTITPLTTREKCSVQPSRITTKLHEMTYRASRSSSVDRTRWTCRFRPVLFSS